MERFINDKINGTQFDIEFCNMWRLDTDKIYSLKEFLNKINDVDLTKLEGFSVLLSNLFTDYDVFQPDLDSTFVECNMLRENGDLTEEQLKNSIRDAILESKKFF